MAGEIIKVGGREFYQTGISEAPDIGFRIITLAYIDQVEATKSDACLVTVQQGGRTPILEVIDHEVVLTDQPLKGTGTLLRYNPRWQHNFRIDVTREDTLSVFAYRFGTLFAWVAGAEASLEVFGTNTPPYNKDQERQLDIDDPRVPLIFRSTLLRLNQLQPIFLNIS